MKRIAICVAILASIVAVAIIGSEFYPAFYRARIAHGDESPKVMAYLPEFASAVGDRVHPVTGLPLPEVCGCLGSGTQGSPDGRWRLVQSQLSNYYHRITLLGSTTTDEVITLQERDPGSGTAHYFGWSSDSSAIFIYGAGRPAGHQQSDSLALIYLLETKTLYGVDLKRFRKGS